MCPPVQKKSPLLALLFLCLALGVAAPAAAQDYPPLREPLEIEQVPGAPIYYTVGNPGVPSQENQGNTSNAGFVITSAGVVVFDALGTPSLGLALLQAIRGRTSQPIRYNVVSHYHADHIYGLAGVPRLYRHDHHRPGPGPRI